MATASRGIQTIVRKKGREVTMMYRVQVDKKGFKADKLFEDLSDAETFLGDTRTPDGRLAILEGRDRCSVKQKAISSYIDNRFAGTDITLDAAISAYCHKYIDDKIESGSDRVKRSAKINKDRLKYAATIRVGRIKPGFSVPTGEFAHLRAQSKGFEMIPMGKFKLSELTEQETTDFVRIRLTKFGKDGAGVAKATVKREVSAFQSVINKLRYTDNKSFVALKGHNPFKTVDKSFFNGSSKPRRRVITEAEEETLIQHLLACRKPHMMVIFAISLETGLRRSEVLGLRWDQVDLERGIINLDPDETKVGEERLVPLSSEAVQAIKTLPRDGEGLFKLTIEGYKTNFTRLIKKAGLENLHHHDLRRSCVSRMLSELTSSSVAIADRMGAKSVRSLEKSIIGPLKKQRIAERGRPKTEEEVRMIIGHASQDQSLGYTNISGLTRSQGAKK